MSFTHAKEPKDAHVSGRYRSNPGQSHHKSCPYTTRIWYFIIRPRHALHTITTRYHDKMGKMVPKSLQYPATHNIQNMASHSYIFKIHTKNNHTIPNVSNLSYMTGTLPPINPEGLVPNRPNIRSRIQNSQH